MLVYYNLLEARYCAAFWADRKGIVAKDWFPKYPKLPPPQSHSLPKTSVSIGISEVFVSTAKMSRIQKMDFRLGIPLESLRSSGMKIGSFFPKQPEQEPATS